MNKIKYYKQNKNFSFLYVLFCAVCGAYCRLRGSSQAIKAVKLFILLKFIAHKRRMFVTTKEHVEQRSC